MPVGSKPLPDIKVCRIRKLASGQLECMVESPVSCDYVRVDNKGFYCKFAFPLDKKEKR